jgi:SAM-dependent methyltransferase
MFFADPVAAFTNLGRALRPGAWLVMLVWQRRVRNEWATAIDEALSADTAPKPVTAPNPFSLADSTTTHRILATAGFRNVQLADVRELVYYGADVDDAHSAVLVSERLGHASVSFTLDTYGHVMPGQQAQAAAAAASLLKA